MPGSRSSTNLDAILKNVGITTSLIFFAEPIGGHLPRSNYEASVLTIETLFGWVTNSAALQAALAQRPPAPAATT